MVHVIMHMHVYKIFFKNVNVINEKSDLQEQMQI